MGKTRGTNIERRKCQITFGSDFSGLDTGFIVAKKLLARVGRRAENVFSCDSALVCKKLMAQTCPAKVHYDDICKRDTSSMEPVDVFRCTPPCGPFSAAGLKDGVEAPQGRLLFASLDYIRVHKPRAVVMDNSPLLVGKFKYDLAYVLAMLKKSSTVSASRSLRQMISAFRRLGSDCMWLECSSSLSGKMRNGGLSLIQTALALTS